MINKALILPTGNEIKSGIVLDTDSPMVMQQLLRLNPEAVILRECPLIDDERIISDLIKKAAAADYDLVVIIGGSGGGHRFSETLGEDYSHSALAELLDDYYSKEIYGKNGHMWCKLICGLFNHTLFINIPGPYREASAAMEAFITTYGRNQKDLKNINDQMAKAVIEQYPVGITCKGIVE